MVVQARTKIYSLTKNISSRDCLSILIDELKNKDELKEGKLGFISTSGIDDNIFLIIEYSHESVQNEFDGLILMEKKFSSFSNDHKTTPCALYTYESFIINNSDYVYDIVITNAGEQLGLDIDILVLYLKSVLDPSICKISTFKPSIHDKPKILIKPVDAYRTDEVFNIYESLLNIENIDISIEKHLSEFAKLLRE